MVEANLANIEGLRARLSSKQAGPYDHRGDQFKPWRRSLYMAFTFHSFLRISIFILVFFFLAVALFTLPVEQILKNFLIWVEQDFGPWGPIVLAVSYIPLTVLAVPASILTVGGGYLFGLPVGFIADSIGATFGALAAFLLGRTVARSFVISKLKDFPQFRAVATAIQRSGFKIVLLLRFVPLLPFNMMNYLLSVTPVSIGEYVLASWLGMMPITFAFVYVGTTLKDLSDVTHGWSVYSTSRWVFIILGFVVSAILMSCVTKVAKAALERALSENEDLDGIMALPQLPLVADPTNDLDRPLIVKIDPSQGNHEN